MLVGYGTGEMYSFDLSGRLLEGVVGGVGLRRALDGRVLEKLCQAEPGAILRRRRRLLPRPQARARVARAYRLLHRAIAGGALADHPALAARLSRVGLRELEEDARRFRTIWAPVPVLPPDQYLAVVVQLTVGCSYGRCTFCSYAGRPFRVRTVPELRRHAQMAREFFGPALPRRTGVFMGDANALALPERRVLQAVEVVREAFAGWPAAGEWYGFVDAFHGRRRSVEGWRQLEQAGLRRVYVGLESGSERVLRLLEKPGSPRDAVELVRALHDAHVSAGVMVMLGAGGRELAGEHVAETAKVLDAMELGPGDFLYLSPLVAGPATAYGQRAAQWGLRALAGREVEAQGLALLEAVRLGRGARWSYYHVEEFVY